jgi:hypothetical protein
VSSTVIQSDPTAAWLTSRVTPERWKLHSIPWVSKSLEKPATYCWCYRAKVFSELSWAVPRRQRQLPTSSCEKLSVTRTAMCWMFSVCHSRSTLSPLHLLWPCSLDQQASWSSAPNVVWPMRGKGTRTKKNEVRVSIPSFVLLLVVGCCWRSGPQLCLSL